jgi:hypothetical protein
LLVAVGTSRFPQTPSTGPLPGQAASPPALTLPSELDRKTSFKRNGPATLADFEAGGRLNVQARFCKAKKNAPQNPSANAQALLAKRVTRHPAKSSGSGDDESEAPTP